MQIRGAEWGHFSALTISCTTQVLSLEIKEEMKQNRKRFIICRARRAFTSPTETSQGERFLRSSFAPSFNSDKRSAGLNCGIVYIANREGHSNTFLPPIKSWERLSFSFCAAFRWPLPHRRLSFKWVNHSVTNESNRGVSLLALHYKLSSLTAPKDSERLKRLNSKTEWRSSLTKKPFKTMFYHRRLKRSIFLTLRGNKIYKMGLMFFPKWAKAEKFIISSGKCSLGSEQRILFQQEQKDLLPHRAPPACH